MNALQTSTWTCFCTIFLLLPISSFRLQCVQDNWEFGKKELRLGKIVLNYHPTRHSNSETLASFTDFLTWKSLMSWFDLAFFRVLSCLGSTIKLMVPFASSYLCEVGFSALVCIKTKYRSNLDVTAEMRCALSITPPDFEKLRRDMHQAHPSH